MSHKQHAKVNAAGHIRGQHGLLFVSLVEGLPPQEVLILPVEVSKKVFWAFIADGTGRILQPDFDFNSLREGLDQFVLRLRQAIDTYHPRLLLIGLEPTGVYHEPLLRHLYTVFAAELARSPGDPDLVLRLCYVDSGAVAHNRSEKGLRTFKTDHVDLAAIADLLLRGEGSPGIPALRTLPQARSLGLRFFVTIPLQGFLPFGRGRDENLHC